jgi:hypothetical protein
VLVWPLSHGMVKQQANQGLSDAANKDDTINACGYFTNRTGGTAMAAAVLCAFGGGKPLRYHNRVRVGVNFDKPRFCIGQITTLAVSYGLPVPVLGGDAEVSVVGA